MFLCYIQSTVVLVALRWSEPDRKAGVTPNSVTAEGGILQFQERFTQTA